jgi:hypothetical protein
MSAGMGNALMTRTVRAAIHSKEVDMVRELAKMNIDVKVFRDEESRTALHYAAQVGDLEIINYLINKGVNLDVVSESGITALHSAISEHHHAAAMVMLDRGANPNLAENDAPSALILALARGEKEEEEDSYTRRMLRRVDECGAPPPWVQCVSSLLKANADPNKKCKEGFAPLHVADHLSIRTLLEHSAEVNVKDSDGDTALHNILSRGIVESDHSEVKIQILLEAGADTEIVNLKGQTPMQSLMEKLSGPTLLEMYNQSVHRDEARESDIDVNGVE